MTQEVSAILVTNTWTFKAGEFEFSSILTIVCVFLDLEELKLDPMP